MNIWSSIDELIDGASDLAGLQAHGLDLLAARRWRTTGHPVPEEVRIHERAAAMADLTVRSILARIRDVLEGPIVLMKGPEVAAHYPGSSLRPFRDLDLLVYDADAAQRKLIAAGWVAISEAKPHHRPELLFPGTLVPIEIHSRPKWPRWTSVDTNELFACAVPSILNVEGIQTLLPSHHALLLAAHSWQHEPIRRLLDLIDVALMKQGIDDVQLKQIADSWDLGRVWEETTQTIGVVLGGDSTSSLLRHYLARHCWHVRSRTAMESRLAYLAGGFWAPTASEIATATAARIFWSLLPTLPRSWATRVAPRVDTFRSTVPRF